MPASEGPACKAGPGVVPGQWAGASALHQQDTFPTDKGGPCAWTLAPQGGLGGAPAFLWESGSLARAGQRPALNETRGAESPVGSLGLQGGICHCRRRESARLAPHGRERGSRRCGVLHPRPASSVLGGAGACPVPVINLSREGTGVLSCRSRGVLGAPDTQTHEAPHSLLCPT